MTEYRSEPGSVSIQHFATHIHLYINDYDFKNERKHVIRDLDDLYSFYRGFVKDVNSEENLNLKRIADSLTNGLVR